MQTAKEMANITKAVLDKSYDEWLASIPQKILKRAQDGWKSITLGCVSDATLDKIRSIYEPLGYVVTEDSNWYGDPEVIISWG